MNLNRLYAEGGRCKLCDADLADNALHDDDCPSLLLENLRYHVTWDSPNCARGCCGRTRGEATCATRAAAIEAAARAHCEWSAHRVCVDLFLVVSEEGVSTEVTARRDALGKEEAERQAAITAERAAAQKKKKALVAALAALEAARGDLTPEAYERWRAELVKEGV